MFIAARTRHLLFFSFIFNALIDSAWASEDPQSETYHVMLAGGSLHLCSSMAPQHCANQDWLSPQMRQQALIELSAARLEALEQASSFAQQPDALPKLLNHLQANLGSRANHQLVPRADFSRQVTDFERSHDIRLSQNDWDLIHDYLEAAQPTYEQVNHSAARKPYGEQVIQQFISMAQAANRQRSEPAPVRILVMTASARDMYDAVGFYLSAFNQDDVEVHWLGLDAALRQAIEQQQCDQLAEFQRKIHGVFDRERAHPELWQIQQNLCHNPAAIDQLIAAADGIFINGGDQSLTRQAFFTNEGEPNPWLDTIQRRVAAGTLAMGGTSAGAAVQPKDPMISNGTSSQALQVPALARQLPPPADCADRQDCPTDLHADALTYHADGGLGVFPFGLVDTHFSERQRQARLIALGADTQTALAIGVDETTALAVNIKTGAFKVSGQHGVWISQHMRRPEPARLQAEFSYLLSGSTGIFEHADITQVEFTQQPFERTVNQTIANGFIAHLDTWCATSEPSHFAWRDQGYRMNANDHTRVLQHSHGCQVLRAEVDFTWLPEGAD